MNLKVLKHGILLSMLLLVSCKSETKKVDQRVLQPQRTEVIKKKITTSSSEENIPNSIQNSDDRKEVVLASNQKDKEEKSSIKKPQKQTERPPKPRPKKPKKSDVSLDGAKLEKVIKQDEVVKSKKPEKTKAEIVEENFEEEVLLDEEENVSTEPDPYEVEKTHPDIAFEKMVHNFGEIDQGDEIEVKFNFTNTGRRDIEIFKAKASCGCTQPSYPFIPIGPNETGYIGVRYNSVGKKGAQNPEIDIYTNLRKQPFRLALEGEIYVDPENDKPIKIIPFPKDTTSGN